MYDNQDEFGWKMGLKWIALGVFIIIFIFNILTPMVADDFNYSYSFADGAKISCIKDICISMKSHFYHTNGRIVAHFLVQFFLWMPHVIFKIINSFMFCGMLLLMYKISLNGQDVYLSPARRRFVFSVLFCSVCYVTPDFGQVYLWMDGSINYLWSIVVSFIYLLPITRLYANSPTYEYHEITECKTRLMGGVLYFFLAFITGAWSENAGAATVLTAVLLEIWIRVVQKRKVPLAYVVSNFCVILGYMSMMLAPAQRSKGVITIDLQYYIQQFKQTFFMQAAYQKVLLVGFTILLISSIIAKVSQQVIVMSLIFMISSFAANYIMIFARYYAPRSMLASICFGIVASLILFTALLDERGHCRNYSIFQRLVHKGRGAIGLGVVIIAVGGLSIIQGGKFIYMYYNADRARVSYIEDEKAKGNLDVVVWTLGARENKYVAAHGLEDITPDITSWLNEPKAKYYGLNTIRVPQ